MMDQRYYSKYRHFSIGCLLLLGLVIVYSLLIVQIHNNYLPVWSDEFFYYKNASSFFYTGTLRAALTFNGSGSRLLGADAHGFAYPLLNGCIAKIFGWNNLNFVYTNLFFVFAALIIVWIQKTITSIQKILITVLVLLFPFFTLYGFTYMQESIHIFFAVTCSTVIYNINKKQKRKYYILFIALVLTASLFRPSWLFWLIGLIPFARGKFQRNTLILIFILGIPISFLITYYFTEPVPNYFSSITNLIVHGEIKAALYSLARHFIYNTYSYFFLTEKQFIYLPIKYLIFAALTFFVFKAFKGKSKLHFSIVLIGVLNFFLLFLLYDVFGWREVRVLASFFYFCAPFLITETNYYFKYIQFSVLIVLFIFTLPLSKQWIAERNGQFKNAFNIRQDVYAEIAQKIGNNKIVFVNYIPEDNTLDLINLPVMNTNNYPINYIVPYYKVKTISYDYILNKTGEKPQGDILFFNQYYQLEKGK
jgi:hypothetical protein